MVLLECTEKNLDIEASLGNGLELAVDGRSNGSEGLCVLSRRGWILEGAVLASPISGPCQMPLATVRVKVRDRWISLLAIHAPPPVPRCKRSNGPTLARIASWVAGGVFNRSVGRCRKGDPAVILGDFNALPFFPAVRAFREAGLVDAFASTNWRFGPTWGPHPWLPALARIDYIMVSELLHVESARTHPLPGSDHRMLSVDLLSSHGGD
jgi:endonuclease/exonuclease/phosphatase family metal-dependent hydrolase